MGQLFGGSDEEVQAAIDREFVMLEAGQEPPDEILEFGEAEITEEDAEEALDQEMRNAPLFTHVDLLPQDSDALRLKIHLMLTEFMAWERKALTLSDLVMATVATGDGDKVIKEILSQAKVRSENNQRLRAACLMDFRLMLLTSPEMEGESLQHWLPEYEGRWEKLERLAEAE